MNDAQIIDTLSRPLGFHLTRTYRVWVGDHGYDTRPWADHKGARFTPPVAYSIEYAANHLQNLNATVEAGGVLEWLSSLPEDTALCIPEYSGYKHIGDYLWKIQDGQPVPYGYDCFRSQATILPDGNYIYWDAA